MHLNYYSQDKHLCLIHQRLEGRHPWVLPLGSAVWDPTGDALGEHRARYGPPDRPRLRGSNGLQFGDGLGTVGQLVAPPRLPFFTSKAGKWGSPVSHLYIFGLQALTSYTSTGWDRFIHQRPTSGADTCISLLGKVCLDPSVVTM